MRAWCLVTCVAIAGLTTTANAAKWYFGRLSAVDLRFDSNGGTFTATGTDGSLTAYLNSYSKLVNVPGYSQSKFTSIRGTFQVKIPVIYVQYSLDEVPPRQVAFTEVQQGYIGGNLKCSGASETPLSGRLEFFSKSHLDVWSDTASQKVTYPSGLYPLASEVKTPTFRSGLYSSSVGIWKLIGSKNGRKAYLNYVLRRTGTFESVADVVINAYSGYTSESKSTVEFKYKIRSNR